MTNIKEKGERLKFLAETFLKEDKKIFVKDMYGNIYFADILLVGDQYLVLQCFSPKQREGKTESIPWPIVTLIEEYKSRGSI